MATKYKIDHLREEAITYLIHDYPSELASWDEQQVPKNRALTTRPHPYSVVHLATLCDVPVVLPAAFLECILDCDLGDLFEEPISENLSLDNKRVCLDGLKAFASVQKNTFMYLAPPYTPAGAYCKNPLQCLEVKASLLWHLASQPLALRGMQPWSLFAGEPPLCSVCRETCSRMHEESRWRMWEELPGIFQLPPWRELAYLNGERS